MSNEKVKERIYLYYSNKTYVYIRLNNRNFYNGVITQVNDKSFKIKDDLLGEVPILFSDVDIADISNKVRGGLK